MSRAESSPSYNKGLKRGTDYPSNFRLTFCCLFPNDGCLKEEHAAPRALHHAKRLGGSGQVKVAVPLSTFSGKYHLDQSVERMNSRH